MILNGAGWTVLYEKIVRVKRLYGFNCKVFNPSAIDVWDKYNCITNLSVDESRCSHWRIRRWISLSFSGVSLVQISFFGESHTSPYLQNWSTKCLIVLFFGTVTLGNPLKNYPVYVCTACYTLFAKQIFWWKNVFQRNPFYTLFIYSSFVTTIVSTNIPFEFLQKTASTVKQWQNTCDKK